MQNSPSDTTNTMSVDIRLCGNIPRNEMKDRFGGAPLTLTALTSRTGISAHRLAETNGGPTLPKTVCDSSFPSAPALILQNSTNNNDKMARGVLVENQQHHSQPLAPVLEPPSWAVPARGETRLEVRLGYWFAFTVSRLFKLQLTLWFFKLLLFDSRSVNHWEDKQPSI